MPQKAKTNTCECGKVIALKYFQCYECKKIGDKWESDFTRYHYLDFLKKIGNNITSESV